MEPRVFPEVVSVNAVRIAFIITGLLGLIVAAVGLLSTTHAESVTGLVVTAAAVVGYFGIGWVGR